MGPPLDLMSQASVKAFAQAILKRPGGLHILVNNAGLGYCKKSFTEEGVGMLTQVRARCGRLTGACQGTCRLPAPSTYT